MGGVGGEFAGGSSFTKRIQYLGFEMYDYATSYHFYYFRALGMSLQVIKMKTCWQAHKTTTTG